jgi:N utilization substance protein B
MRFVNNRLIGLLRDNKQLQRYVNENKISWAPYSEIFRSFFEKIQQQTYFINFMTRDEIAFRDEVKVVTDILEQDVSQWSELESALEEMSIFWNDDVDFVLSMAIKTIKTFHENDTADKALLPMYKTEDDVEYARKLLRKAILNSPDGSSDYAAGTCRNY